MPLPRDFGTSRSWRRTFGRRRPVYVTSNGIYAAGIISGVSNYSTNCIGEPGGGGRVCSATVLYAPVTELVGKGYGLNYVP